MLKAVVHFCSGVGAGAGANNTCSGIMTVTAVTTKTIEHNKCYNRTGTAQPEKEES